LKLLTLSLHDLGEADRKLLGVFLRFAGRTERHQWSLSDGGPVHLEVRGAPDDGRTQPMAPAPRNAAPTLWIVGAGHAAPGVARHALRRPLQIEAFAQVLREREAELDAQAAPAPRIAAPLRAAAPMPAPRAAPAVSTPATIAAPVPSPALHAGVSAGTGLAPSRRILNDRATAYRLARWPGADLLRGKPKFVRLLGFITHKPLTVERLALLSGVDEASCLEMLALLDERRLLQRVEARPESTVAPVTELPADSTLQSAISDFAHASPQPGAAAPRAAAPVGLLQRLRLRLGI